MKTVINSKVVYFVHACGLGLVKIGLTSSIGERMVNLTAGSPIALRLLGVVPGNYEMEQDFHREASGRNHHSEWYVFTLHEIAEIESVLSKPLSATRKIDALKTMLRRTAKFMPDMDVVGDLHAGQTMIAAAIGIGLNPNIELAIVEINKCRCLPEELRKLRMIYDNEAAAMLGISEEQLATIAAGGLFPCWKFSKKDPLRYRLSDIISFIEDALGKKIYESD